jgi:hypothetical protein
VATHFVIGTLNNFIQGRPSWRPQKSLIPKIGQSYPVPDPFFCDLLESILHVTFTYAYPSAVAFATCNGSYWARKKAPRLGEKGRTTSIGERNNKPHDACIMHCGMCVCWRWSLLTHSWAAASTAGWQTLRPALPRHFQRASEMQSAQHFLCLNNARHFIFGVSCKAISLNTQQGPYAGFAAVFICRNSAWREPMQNGCNCSVVGPGHRGPAGRYRWANPSSLQLAHVTLTSCSQFN